jgi:hypothetical protein
VEIKIENRQKFLIVIAAVALALFLGNSAVYEPLKQAWLDRAKHIADLKQQVAMDKSLLRRKTEILARWQYMQTNVLPVNPSQAGSAILKAKDEWVRKSNVSLDGFSPQLKQDTTDQDSTNVVTTWECRTDASGNMRSLMNFLWAVESDPMGVQLEDIEISAKDNAGEELTLGLTLSALVLDNSQAQTQAP